ncbi:glycine/betaine/sarcosine/D-proline family reductase selenoprotein B [Umezawaea tangerina]|uniref:D-proline reductase (Dithiol) PrdA n=1 Tax=Umezawaea tangerina TaxID=84725 RepID=A0A2T0T773_9PSEU|nr:glycine/betaine/sarcosine/D-proline family reductase selenoprotein B [Umezawaea tangerina]PRY41526.1 D-proline reductase (dithiol) PrdA [Umezawaea tangerina]
MNPNATVPPAPAHGRLPVHCDCEVLPPPSLVQELVAVHEVVRGERTGLRDGVLTVAGDVDADITVPLVTSAAVDVIAPGQRDVRTDTVLDVVPLAVKVDGGVGEGVTRLATGVVLVVTGVDAGGTQLGEAGNSAGVLSERMADAAPGTPDPGDWVIRIAVTIEAGRRMERPGPAAAHRAADVVADRLRRALLDAPPSAVTDRRTLEEPSGPGPRVALVKLVMGQGAMHENLLFPAEPGGVRGAVSLIDLGNLPQQLRVNEVRDGALHSLCCVGPSSKETTLHYYRDPLVEALAEDTDLRLTGVVVVGSPAQEADKRFVARRVGAMVAAAGVDGVVVATEGFGNNHIDFAAEIEEIAKYGTPTVGVCWSAARGMVSGNEYMYALVEVNKAADGQESDVLGENTADAMDARRGIAMLKTLLFGKDTLPSPRSWDAEVPRANQELVEAAAADNGGRPTLTGGMRSEVPVSATAPTPLAPLGRPLSGAVVALVSSAGAHTVGDTPFRPYADYSLREIPATATDDGLTFASGSYDNSDVNADPNCLFPLARLRELAEDGVLGGVSPTHFAMQGGGTEIELVRTRTGPELVRRLEETGVDAVVLIGACGSCHRSAVVLQRLVEQAGIPTVIIASLPAVAAQLGAPRIAATDTPMGAALGAPHDTAQQRRILTAALDLLVDATEAGAVARIAERYRS